MSLGTRRTIVIAAWVFTCVVHVTRAEPVEASYGGVLARRFLFLVDSPSIILDYHNGPVLSGSNGVIPVYLIWYGNFNETDKSAVQNFFSSFDGEDGASTDVARWWNVTGSYKDATGRGVASSVQLAGEMDDAMYSKGKDLHNQDLEELVLSSLTTFPAKPEAVYFVLTASDVLVEDFCMNSCASHFATSPSSTPGGLQLPYAWVGNPKDQCPGMCAWPFALPSYLPTSTSLPLPPNGDLGADALVIQISYMMAGTATNPFNNAYYEGDASVPLEAGTACFGFGAGAYGSYPGDLDKDVITGAVFNAEGINDIKFLLPTLWNPTSRTCTPLPLKP